MSDPMDFEFSVSADGAVVLDGVKVEEPVEGPAPVEADSPVVDEVAQLRRERDQYREQAELYQAFEPMIAAVGRGEMEVPRPPPSPEHVVGYRRRLSAPGSAEIIQLVRDYAETLSEEQKEILDSNHAAFNEVFDKIASLNPPPPPRVSRRMAERTLRQHEQLVDAGRSLRSGVLPEVMPDHPLKWKAAETLKKRIAHGHRDSEVALARLLYVDGSDS